MKGPMPSNEQIRAIWDEAAEAAAEQAEQDAEVRP